MYTHVHIHSIINNTELLMEHTMQTVSLVNLSIFLSTFRIYPENMIKFLSSWRSPREDLLSSFNQVSFFPINYDDKYILIRIFIGLSSHDKRILLPRE